MDSSSLNLGNQIAVATVKLAQDQQRATGEAVLQLIESAAVSTAQVASPVGSVGNNVDVKV